MPDVKTAEGSSCRFFMHSTSSTPPRIAWRGNVSLVLTHMINGHWISCVFDRYRACRLKRLLIGSLNLTFWDNFLDFRIYSCKSASWHRYSDLFWWNIVFFHRDITFCKVRLWWEASFWIFDMITFCTWSHKYISETQTEPSVLQHLFQGSCTEALHHKLFLNSVFSSHITLWMIAHYYNMKRLPRNKVKHNLFLDFPANHCRTSSARGRMKYPFTVCFQTPCTPGFRFPGPLTVASLYRKWI